MAMKLNGPEKLAAIVIAVALILALCGGCGSNEARIEQHGSGTAEIDQKQGVLVIDEVKKLIEAQVTGKIDELNAKLEARVGTQEKTDNSTVAGNQNKADAQQAGLFNFSFQEVVGGGLGLSVLMAFTILLYAMRKQNERTERARADREWSETERDWLQENARLRMASKELLAPEYKPVPPPEACRRGWWPTSKCRMEAAQSQ